MKTIIKSCRFLIALTLPIFFLLTADVFPQAAWPGTSPNTNIKWVGYTNSNGTLVADVTGEASITAIQDITTDTAENHKGSVDIACDGTNIFFRVLVNGDPTNAGGNVNNSLGFVIEIADAANTYQAAVALIKDQGADVIKVSNAAATLTNSIYSSKTTPGAVRISQVATGSTKYFVDFQVPLSSITAVWSGYGSGTSSKYYFGTTAGSGLNVINKDWMSGNVSTVDFAAISTAKPTSIATGTLYSSNISGTVTGAGLSVTLSYTDTTGKTVTTDASNNYSFPVSYNWSGTVVPSKTGYTFSPVSSVYTNLLTNLTAQNYSVSTVRVSGTVTNSSGTTIIYTGSGGSASGSVNADGSGYYEFWVAPGWTGTITTSQSGYTSSPASIVISSAVTSPTGGQNFTELLSPVVSGRVLTQSAGTAIAGATLSYTGTSSGSVSSNANGSYSITFVNGSGETITPSKTGYTFTPANRTYSNLTVHQTNQDYYISTLQITGTTTVPGATISYFDSTSKTVTSDGSGNYSIWVPYNWSGTLSPSKTGMTFTPQTVSAMSQPVVENFVPVCSISGTTNRGVATISYVYNSTQHTTYTDSSGYYSFNVPYNTSSVTITPAIANYYFTPVSLTATNITTNVVMDPFSSVLPVELTNFSAGISGEYVVLQWKTATEIGNFGFDVERKISDDAVWQKIVFIEGSGNSNSPKEYSFTDKSVKGNCRYNYRLKQIDNEGTFEYSNIINAVVEAPKDFSLLQNYPNPFNPSTRIKYSLPADSRVTLELFSVTGVKIAGLVNKPVSAGYYDYDLNMVQYGLSAGMYIYRLTAVENATGRSYTDVKKMIYLK